MPLVTPPAGKHLERLVAAIHHAESTGAQVTWNDVIGGRQFDVTIRFTFGIHTYLTVIECKDYSSKVPVEKLDALVTKARDAKANKAIMISTNGFQSGCLSVAERHAIQLLVLTEKTEPPLPELVAKITPGLNVWDINFSMSAIAENITFEDWGGRLAYLMNHSRVVTTIGTKTPNQIVTEWQLTKPSLELDRPNSVSIPLPAGAELHMPLEASLPVSTMNFTCAFIEVIIPKKPMPDNHVLAGWNTRVELADPQGRVQHAARLNEIPMGFDSPVAVGGFYETPSMFNRYYCENIEGEMITWTLLESYQHGHLLQATFNQKAKYSVHYVEVTDRVVVQRLQKMLAKLRTKK